jgi:GT2 family glycosyltransferase
MTGHFLFSLYRKLPLSLATRQKIRDFVLNRCPLLVRFTPLHRELTAQEQTRIKAAALLEEADPNAVATVLGANRDVAGPLRLVAGVVLYNNEVAHIAELMRSIRLAAATLPAGVTVDIRLLDNGTKAFDASALPDPSAYQHSGANLGFGKGHNVLMRQAFEGGADFYLGVNPDGLLHPDCLTHLLRMAQAEQEEGGPGSLLEAIQFPEEHPKWYDPRTFDTPWISGACFLMPRAVFRDTQGFDENMFLYCEDVDLSWRVRLAGYRTRICPAAVFLHDVSDRGDEPWRFKEMLLAGRYLGRKWGSPAFVEQAEKLLLNRKMIDSPKDFPSLDRVPVIKSPGNIPDFDHSFSFAPTRW